MAEHLTPEDRDVLAPFTGSEYSLFGPVERIVARHRAAALREAADEWATAWEAAFEAAQVHDDLSAVTAMEEWLRDRADRESGGQV